MEIVEQALDIVCPDAIDRNVTKERKRQVDKKRQMLRSKLMDILAPIEKRTLKAEDDVESLQESIRRIYTFALNCETNSTTFDIIREEYRKLF